MSISCKQATDYISKKEEGKLTLFQRYQLWRHLAVCYLCKRFDKHNKQMLTNIKQHKDDETTAELPRKTKEAILRALANAKD